MNINNKYKCEKLFINQKITNINGTEVKCNDNLSIKGTFLLFIIATISLPITLLKMTIKTSKIKKDYKKSFIKTIEIK